MAELPVAPKGERILQYPSRDRVNDPRGAPSNRDRLRSSMKTQHCFTDADERSPNDRIPSTAANRNRDTRTVPAVWARASIRWISNIEAEMRGLRPRLFLCRSCRWSCILRHLLHLRSSCSLRLLVGGLFRAPNMDACGGFAADHPTGLHLAPSPSQGLAGKQSILLQGGRGAYRSGLSP